MMSSAEFEMKELDEFTEKAYYQLCTDYPKVASKFMDKKLNECKSEARRRTPRSEKKPKKYKKSRHLQDCWRVKQFKKPGKTFGVLMNNAPHSHLIEHGHVTKNGGFVEGVHMLENTMTHQQPKIDRDIEKLVDTVFNKITK